MVRDLGQRRTAMQLLHPGAMPADGERSRRSMYSESGRQCTANYAVSTVIRECARVVAAPATGSWSATRARRIRAPRAPQQLARETDHADPPSHHWSRATRAGALVCVCPADDCGPEQPVHAGGLCREICNDTGKNRTSPVVSTGQARDTEKGW